MLQGGAQSRNRKCKGPAHPATFHFLYMTPSFVPNTHSLRKKSSSRSSACACVCVCVCFYRSNTRRGRGKHNTSNNRKKGITMLLLHCVCVSICVCLCPYSTQMLLQMYTARSFSIGPVRWSISSSLSSQKNKKILHKRGNLMNLPYHKILQMTGWLQFQTLTGTKNQRKLKGVWAVGTCHTCLK